MMNVLPSSDQAWNSLENNNHRCECKEGEAHSSQDDIDERKVIIANQYTEVTLFRSWRPLFMVAKFFGLYFVKNYPADDLDDGKKLSWMEWKCPKLQEKRKNAVNKSSVTPSQIWCVIVIILLYSNAFRLFTVIDPKNGFGPILFQQIIVIAWNLLCAINATAMYVGWLKKDALPKYFLVWQELHPHHNEAAMMCKHSFRKKLIIYLFLFFTGIALNVAFRL